MADWRDTLNLPNTGFPMKANLQATEPQMLAHWDAIDLYRTLRERRRGAPVFILHDGPPYANGNVHLGTSLNKVLKDIVVRSRSMMGFDAPYVPGWDCHGLPIELRLLKELGPKKQDMGVGDLRRACRAYAARFVDVQREQFKRLGVLGDWSDPYLTMDSRYQAAIVRALGRFVEQGMVYKGKKPVHWCIHCRTALAEAEVEYEDRSDPAIYVKFPVRGLEARVPELGGRPVSVVISDDSPERDTLRLARSPSESSDARSTTPMQATPSTAGTTNLGSAGRTSTAMPIARATIAMRPSVSTSTGSEADASSSP